MGWIFFVSYAIVSTICCALFAEAIGYKANLRDYDDFGFLALPIWALGVLLFPICLIARAHHK